MENKVSVIIPVYNVEKFVSECLSSVLNQTYKNLEIIIVNDGSTDNSELICKTFQNQDNRIKYISKTNGGLSSARNEGLKYVTGKYVVFIDSDDYIKNNMIEVLVRNLENEHADVVCCNYDVCDENSKIIKSHSVCLDSSKVFSSQEAVDVLLYESYFQCYAWNKMYKIELFRDIRYPEGKLYEDIVTTYRLFCKSNKILFLPESYYCYRVRSNSITKKGFNQKSYDLIEAVDFIRNRNKNNSEVLMGCLIYYLYFIDDMIRSGYWDNNIYVVYKEMFRKLKKNIKKCSNISIARKTQIYLSCINIKMYINLYKFIVKHTE